MCICDFLPSPNIILKSLGYFSASITTSDTAESLMHIVTEKNKILPIPNSTFSWKLLYFLTQPFNEENFKRKKKILLLLYRK